MTMVTGELFLH